MATGTPEITAAESAELERRLRRLAGWLDSALTIPGTRIRIGADALIGLIPGIGDLAGLALGLWLLWEGRQLRAPAGLQWRMLGNLLIEVLLGWVPVLGDIFDLAWRANQRNVDLLLHWSGRPGERPRPARRPWGLLAALILGGCALWLLIRVGLH